jgi:hypothetical protein
MQQFPSHQQDRPTEDIPTQDGPTEEIGDPVCWLARVCPDCGRLSEDRSADVCANCGADLPT